ncbi:MAG: CHAT domain-containing protein [Sphingomicrobium sp.]
MIKVILATAAVALAWSPASAAAPISARDSFRIGTAGTVYCSAQSLEIDAALGGMFDRGYAVTCRDAAQPVGHIYALRLAGDPVARLASIRAERATCTAPKQGLVADLGTVVMTDCTMKDADVGYRVYQVQKGRVFYVAEGLAGYDSALQLGLRSVVADQLIKGEVAIATTGAGDPAAFARVQAGALDPTRALAEAYRRNNAGSYADSAEFFAAVSGANDAPVSRTEGLVNEALQKSNLGRYAEADALFSRAADAVGDDPLVVRQLRNYRVMDLLNQGRPGAALELLDKPLAHGSQYGGDAARIGIDAPTARRLNAESPIARQLGGASTTLLPEEKVEILDGQALQLRGAALRLQKRDDQAETALAAANAKLAAVRGGKVASVAWMRAQILSDRAAVAEAANKPADADRLYRESVTVLEASYPGSAALLSARAQHAGYLARSGQVAAAEPMFRDIVETLAAAGSGAPSLARVLAPYAKLLLRNGDDSASLARLFEATQVMLRPGVAQTQAVLARELSGGSDDAARLFRQSVTLTRQIDRAAVELKRLSAVDQSNPEDTAKARALRAGLIVAEKQQAETQAKLASYPRFRAVSAETISLTDLQKLLRDGEAYYKMTVVGGEVIALVATPTGAHAAKIAVSAAQLDEQVDALRDTISRVENGKRVTDVFDVALSRLLYDELIKPFEAQVAGARHLIFEPDGAMLRLPPNLLLMSDAGLAAYKARADASDDGAFDFTGLQWLGRDRDISTSVSATAFRAVRNAPPAAGTRQYLGLGENLPATAAVQTADGTRSVQDLDCVLSLASWSRPISPEELRIAGGLLSAGDPRLAEIDVRDAFTDTALKARGDLDQFRILHFATHGIVTAPQKKCPAQPALMTSFGGAGSDGLLTFREIFDLRLDADLVILSACDTASKASAAATRDAGLSTGGDVALDGLVRAFVGAGSRLVIASHWPVPDDFNATQRLITGLFTAPPGTATATALRLSELRLMDDPQTSHPFYWSGFATIGDGAAPVIRRPQAVAQR